MRKDANNKKMEVEHGLKNLTRWSSAATQNFSSRKASRLFFENYSIVDWGRCLQHYQRRRVPTADPFQRVYHPHRREKYDGSIGWKSNYRNQVSNGFLI
jgi:hypothetical protein